MNDGVESIEVTYVMPETDVLQNGVPQAPVLAKSGSPSESQRLARTCWMRLLTKTVWPMAASLHQQLRNEESYIGQTAVEAQSAYLRCWDAIAQRNRNGLLQASVELIAQYGYEHPTIAWPWGELDFLPPMRELLSTMIENGELVSPEWQATVPRLTRRQYQELDAQRRLMKIESGLPALCTIYSNCGRLLGVKEVAALARQAFDRQDFRQCRVYTRLFYRQFPFV
jgi:hypothetical protein